MSAEQDQHRDQIPDSPSAIESASAKAKVDDAREPVERLDNETRNHDVIKAWAAQRQAQPATVPGSERGADLGVLCFDFPGYGGDDLRRVGWDEWLSAFDRRHLNFVYRERRADGLQSNFFRLKRPGRGDTQRAGASDG
jgi:hypothetical protein